MTVASLADGGVGRGTQRGADPVSSSSASGVPLLVPGSRVRQIALLAYWGLGSGAPKASEQLPQFLIVGPAHASWAPFASGTVSPTWSAVCRRPLRDRLGVGGQCDGSLSARLL